MRAPLRYGLVLEDPLPRLRLSLYARFRIPITGAVEYRSGELTVKRENGYDCD